jgi:glycerol-3-phosphate cytidylyltransferase-like family protein
MTFDTRHKIITLEQARAIAAESGVPSSAFVTHLEVLRASHICKLQEVAAANQGRLFVILIDPKTPLVPLPERAEMAAALRVVDYVIPVPAGAGATGVDQALDALHPDVTVHDEEEDRERTRLLIEHVRSRVRS